MKKITLSLIVFCFLNTVVTAQDNSFSVTIETVSCNNILSISDGSVSWPCENINTFFYASFVQRNMQYLYMPSDKSDKPIFTTNNLGKIPDNLKKVTTLKFEADDGRQGVVSDLSGILKLQLPEQDTFEIYSLPSQEKFGFAFDGNAWDAELDGSTQTWRLERGSPYAGVFYLTGLMVATGGATWFLMSYLIKPLEPYKTTAYYTQAEVDQEKADYDAEVAQHEQRRWISLGVTLAGVGLTYYGITLRANAIMVDRKF